MTTSAAAAAAPTADVAADEDESRSVDELFAKALEQGQDNEQADHVDPPGSPPHTHAEPGSAGDVLAKALEESLADEDSTIGGGYMESSDTHGQSEGLTLGGGEATESVYSGARCDPAAPVRRYDVAASDGVITGFAYEQSVRPFAEAGEALQADAPAGSLTVDLGSAARFQAGVLVGVGMDQSETFEIKRIVSVDGDRIVFEEPLGNAHAAGEIVSTEFVRYRWYPDLQFDTAYFHDHLDALVSWKHELFGAVISEPSGSTYHDPFTDAQVRSGNVVDIHTDAVVSPDVTGSFRELVMFIQDNNLTTHLGRSSGSSLSLRAEPLERRGGDPSLWFDSRTHGDPATVVLHTYLGDPIVVRALVGGTNDVHTWHLDGHWFRGERFSTYSRPIGTVHLGISERYDLIVPAAGGPQRIPGDYL